MKPIDLLYQKIKKRYPEIEFDHNPDSSNHLDMISLAIVDIADRIENFERREHPYSEETINEGIKLLDENRYLSYNLLTKKFDFSPFKARQLMSIIKKKKDVVEFYGGKGGKRFLCKPSDMPLIKAMFGGHPREKRVSDRVKRIAVILDKETNWNDYKSIRNLYVTIYPLHTPQRVSYFIRQVKGVSFFKKNFITVPDVDDLLIAKGGTPSEKKLKKMIKEKEMKDKFTKTTGRSWDGEEDTKKDSLRNAKSTENKVKVCDERKEKEDCNGDNPENGNPTPRYCCDCIHYGNQSHLGEIEWCGKKLKYVSRRNDASDCDSYERKENPNLKNRRRNEKNSD